MSIYFTIFADCSTFEDWTKNIDCGIPCMACSAVLLKTVQFKQPRNHLVLHGNHFSIFEEKCVDGATKPKIKPKLSLVVNELGFLQRHVKFSRPQMREFCLFTYPPS